MLAAIFIERLLRVREIRLRMPLDSQGDTPLGALAARVASELTISSALQQVKRSFQRQ